MQENRIDIQKLIKIARKASDAILEVYNDHSLFNIVDFKSDDSPLTIADKRSHNIIANELMNLYPEIPIISEEGHQIQYEDRKDWKTFWLVDPLDGTKEFIKKNGEFTVNIALIKNRHPVFGLIHVPVKGSTYWGEENIGAVRVQENGNVIGLKVSDRKNDLVAVRSRSHGSPEEERLYKSHNVTDYLSVGSSLKFCMVAEGKADIYYRYGPTMEWDTAAGQAIVEAAGGKVMIDQGSERFSYNKKSMLNESFLVTT